MSHGKFVIAADAMDDWRDDVLTGKPPTFFPIAEDGPLSRIEIGPKMITLVGGAPGAGKTAFIMQSVVDALRLSPDLKAVVCNIEMPAEVLMDRQLSRLSGVTLDDIRYRRLNELHADRVDTALATMDGFADRLCFVRPPFTLENVAMTAGSFASFASGAKVLLVFDYIQRITPPGESVDKRGSIDATMNYLRQFADAGAAVIVVSSVGRQRDNKGRSSYSGESMNLASFKESGELEFGADDAFILTHGETQGVVRLNHLKARHRATEDVEMQFSGATQSFVAIENDGGDVVDGGGLVAVNPVLSGAWSSKSSGPPEMTPWEP